MALQKQVVPLSFNGGIDTKTDANQVLPSKLLVLENGVFTNKGKIKKRNGYDKLGSDVYKTTDKLSNGLAITNYQNELLVANGEKLYSYGNAVNNWIDKGRIESVSLDQFPVKRNDVGQTNQITAYNPKGFYLFAWKESGIFYYSIVDVITEQIVVDSQQVAATAVNVQVVSFGFSFLIVYSDSTDLILHAYTIDLTAGYVKNPIASNSATMNANKIFDVTTNTAGALIAYQGAVNIEVRDLGLTSTSLSSVLETITGGIATTCISIAADSSASYCVSWYNNTDVKKHIAGVTTLVATTSFVTLISSIWNGTSYNIFSSTSNTNTTYYDASVFKLSVTLASKPFISNGTVYVVVNYSPTDSLQPTYFVVAIDGMIVCKVLPSLSGGTSSSFILPSVNKIDENNFQTSMLRKDLLYTESGKVFTQTGVEAILFNFFDSQRSYLRGQLADTIHFSGGFLSMYDGIGVVEHGFHIYPEGVTATPRAGGSLPVGSYQYIVCYEWTDNKGNIHRSAPSLPAPLTTAAGNLSTTLQIPYLRLTAKNKVQIVIYRTQNNLGIFYRLTTITNPIYNNPLLDTFSVIDYGDNTSNPNLHGDNTKLNGNGLLYTTGGVVDNIAPPACASITTYKNRLFVLPSDNHLQLWYSKQVVENTPVEFSDVFTASIDSYGGDVTAISNLDDKLIAFKSNSIFYMTGTGPDNTGAQNDFTAFQLVTTDSGCINPRSVVLTPDGVIYQSSKGIYLLDRSLQSQYVGADVEGFNDANVVSAKLIPYTNQVRLCLDSGMVLVYDYYYRQWSTFTNINATDSTIFDNLLAYVGVSGSVYLENKSSYSDSGTPIKLKLSTAWLSLLGLQGFQRIHKMLILGDYISPHTLRIDIAYDFNPNSTQSESIDAGLLLESSTYGESSSQAPYGSDPLYGIDNGIQEYPLYQWRVFTERQKCQSIQITLEDGQNIQIGEGMSLSGITLEVSGKQGMFKTSAARSV